MRTFTLAREVNSGHTRICVLGAIFGLSSQISPSVIVRHTHVTRTVVSRSTINTITLAGIHHSSILFDHIRWLHIMTLIQFCTITIVQHLTEEQIVIWPDRIELRLIALFLVSVETLISLRRNVATSKAVVTVGIAVLHIFYSNKWCTTIIIIIIIVTRRTEVRTFCVCLVRLKCQFVVCTNSEITSLHLGVIYTSIHIAVTLMEVEVVQIICYRTIVEFLIIHGTSFTSITTRGGNLCIIVSCGVIQCFIP